MPPPPTMWEILTAIWPVILFLAGLVAWAARLDYFSRHHGQRLDKHASDLIAQAEAMLEHERLPGHATGVAEQRAIKESIDRIEATLEGFEGEVRETLARMEETNKQDRHDLANRITSALERLDERIEKAHERINGLG